MRKIRGVKLLRENKIPIVRPSERIIIFDLDDIDRWLGGEGGEKKAID